MKIGDLGIKKKRTNEGIVSSVVQKASEYGLLGQDNQKAADKNREWQLQQQSFVKLFQQRVEKLIQSGQIADPTKETTAPQQAQQAQPQTQQQTQQKQGFTQGNYKQNGTTVKMNTAIPTKPVQQGQTNQQDNDLAAAVKAAKAKPGFQQTAADKAYIRQGAAKGIHEQALTDYVWFNTIIEGVVENSKFLAEINAQNSGTPTLATWVKHFIDSQISSYGPGAQIAKQKYDSTYTQLAQQFEEEYKKSGAFPTKIAQQIFVYLKNAEYIGQNGDDAGDTVDAMSGGAQSQGGQQGQPQDIKTVLAKQTGELASNDATRVATAVGEIIKASGFQPDMILKIITPVSGAKSSTSTPTGTTPAPSGQA